MSDSDYNLDKEIEEGLARAEKMIAKRRIFIGIGAIIVLAIVFLLGGLVFNPHAFGFIPMTGTQVANTLTASQFTPTLTNVMITATYPPSTVAPTNSPQPSLTQIPKALKVILLGHNKVNDSYQDYFQLLNVETKTIEKSVKLPWMSWISELSLSPNGKNLVFGCAYGQVGGEICNINIDTFGVKRLTDNNLDDSYPRWSPDSKLIAFACRRMDGNGICTISPNGQDLKQIGIYSDPTDDLNGSGFLEWSKDGQKIFFATDDIYALDVHSGKIKNLTNNHSWNWSAALSPDKEKIMCETGSEIFTMDIDGTSLSKIQLPEKMDYYNMVSWSPTMQNLVFYGSKDNVSQYYLTSADGQRMSNLTDLTNLKEEHLGAKWSPSQSEEKIAFITKNGQSLYSLYSINADGTGLKKLADGLNMQQYYFLSQLEWSPEGKNLSFVSTENGQSVLNIIAIRDDSVSSIDRKVTNLDTINSYLWLVP